MTQEKTKNKDFVEIKFTGFANNEMFDSNIAEDLHKINPKAKEDKLIVVVGESMVVKGFDNELQDKELDKEYEIVVKPSEGFGQRNKTLMKTILKKLVLME